MDIENFSAVKIAVRERPLFPSEKDAGCQKIVYSHSTEDKILIIDDRPFVFDQVLGSETSQQCLYNELIQPLVLKTIEGFYCTAFAYGQTGTGKTYTIGLQLDSFDGQNAGMISRSLDDIFLKTEGTNANISVSFIEIYNEKVFDLLSSNFAEAVNTKACKFTGGTQKPVDKPSEAKEIIIEGNKNRHVRETKMNPSSSRSHAIFTIHLTSVKGNTKTVSSLHLVDLAGSEGVRRTGHQGLALAEGVHINQGLLCVSKVLHALSSGLKVIPYRDSILSTVLQDSLNSNSYLTLLACISPSNEDFNETLSTLRFANNAKLMKNNPQINAILADLKKRNKTPVKSYMAPTFRGGGNGVAIPKNISTIKKPTPLKTTNNINNTFCTPSKVRKTDYTPSQNRTYVDIFGGNKLRTSTVYRPPVAAKKEKEKRGDIKKCMNDSLESRPSSMYSFNVSSSTAIEAPIATIQNHSLINSHSPLVQKVSEKVIGLFDERFNKLFDAVNNLTTMNQTTATTTTTTTETNEQLVKKILSPIEEINNEAAPLVENSCDRNWKLMKAELQSIVRNELLQMTTAQMQTTEIIDDENELSELSAIFKIPEIPPTVSVENKFIYPNVTINQQQKPLPMRERQRNSTILDDDVFENETILDSVNETVIPKLRSKTNVQEQPTRRSTRISMRRNTLVEPIAMNNTMLEISCRRSKRMSTASHPTTDSNKENKKPRRKQSTQIQVKVIADYFSKKSTNNRPEKNAKSKHVVAVLELINTGTIKELQILPTIGLKTAYQIVTNRLLNGKYKSFEHLAKLPVWKGKAFLRFKEANNLN